MIWKDIEGYEGIYQVSDEGQVRSLNYRRRGTIQILSPNKFKNGYCAVQLCKEHSKKFYVHRLVAQAFIPNPDNKPYTDHINGIRDDNRVVNLRWCTQEENNSFRLARKHMSEGRKDKKQVYQYTLEGELVAIWPSISEVGRNGYYKAHISHCCNGERKTHKGFIWSYEPL